MARKKETEKIRKSKGEKVWQSFSPFDFGNGRYTK